MRGVLFFLFCFTVIYAQSNEEVIFKKVSNSKVQLTHSERAKIDAGLNGRFIKKDYDVAETPDLLRITGESEIMMELENSKTVKYTLCSDKTDNLGNRNLIFKCDLMNYAIFTIRDNKAYGFIQTKKNIYHLEPISDKYHLLKKYDRELADKTLTDRNETVNPGNSDNSTILTNKTGAGINYSRAKTTDIQVDILVAYTPAAKAACANQDIVTLISQAFAQANYTLDNCDINVTLNPVYVCQISYSESGSCLTDVTRFTGTTDGYMDEVHTLRARYGADFCALITATGDEYGRVADINPTISNAFLVVTYDVAVDNLSFAHETGHLFGCRHQIGCDNTIGTMHGYYYPAEVDSEKYRTIMAVQDSRYGDTPNRVPYWSDGAFEGSMHGDINSNNKSQILLTADTKAAFYTGFSNRMDLLSYLPITAADSLQGAAAVQMMLCYMGITAPSLTSIYSSGGATSGPMTATHVKNALAATASGWNWYEYANTNRDVVMTQLIKWVSYNYLYYNPPKTPMYLPGLIPLNGSFSQWGAISGCYLTKNPWTEGVYDTTGVAVTGLWITMPSGEELALETSITGSNKNISYSKTSALQQGDLGVGDFYYNVSTFYDYYLPVNNMYYGVVDPPSGETHSIITGNPVLVDISNTGAILEELKTNLLPKLNNHSGFAAVFEGQQSAETVEIENITKNNAYTLIIIRKNGKTEAGIVVDNTTSELLEINIPPNPVNYNLLTRNEAITFLVSNNKISSANSVSSTRLIYSKKYCKNYYYPLWEITASEGKYYLSQDLDLVETESDESENRNSNNEDSQALQNYPNPFNPTTSIKYKLNSQEHVNITIFDILGRQITTLVDEIKPAGEYSVSFNASNLTSGVYIYRLSAGSKIIQKKMMLVK